MRKGFCVGQFGGESVKQTARVSKPGVETLWKYNGTDDDFHCLLVATMDSIRASCLQLLVHTAPANRPDGAKMAELDLEG